MNPHYSDEAYKLAMVAAVMIEREHITTNEAGTWPEKALKYALDLVAQAELELGDLPKPIKDNLRNILSIAIPGMSFEVIAALEVYIDDRIAEAIEAHPKVEHVDADEGSYGEYQHIKKQHKAEEE